MQHNPGLAAKRFKPRPTRAVSPIKLADPATRVQISASHGKVKRNLSYEEFKRQQVLYKEHADTISQAKLFGKHWHFREKHWVLVVDGVVVGGI
jgi:hypothetical protein